MVVQDDLIPPQILEIPWKLRSTPGWGPGSTSPRRGPGPCSVRARSGDRCPPRAPGFGRGRCHRLLTELWVQEKCTKLIQCMSKTHSKPIQKPSKKHPKTIQKPFKNHPKTIQKPSKNHPKTIQKQFKSSQKLESW